ncbi:MAG: very short patch repair endonuclease [Bacteroidota bacterium]|nr:very short patch repair endonuclease [Bacteroidota bacterium]
MQEYNLENIIQVPRFEESNGFYTTKERSRLMSKIRGKNTKPELLLRKALWHAGLRYRKNFKNLPGKPDIVNNRLKLIIFIDGEFWHGYQWELKKDKIKSNRAFWIPKIERNMQRDLAHNFYYEQKGYKVFRFWAQEIKDELGSCLKQVLDYLHIKEEAGLSKY